MGRLAPPPLRGNSVGLDELVAELANLEQELRATATVARAEPDTRVETDLAAVVAHLEAAEQLLRELL